MGQQRFPKAKDLLITADGGGSNSHRSRLWKVSLQELADELGLRLFVCHFPPGTSKWNKIEHRLFSFITQNWRGKPLVNHQHDRQPDRQHDDTHRSDRQSSTGHQPLRNQNQSAGRTTVTTAVEAS